MPDVFQTECFFLSDEMARLCRDTTDIKIMIKVHYAPGKPPEFEIVAFGQKEGMEGGDPIPGCPYPCR